MPTCTKCGQANPDGFRLCGMCGTPFAAAASERRKLVTLLFCDLSGSTALGERIDAETIREIMFRYFAAVRDPIERHGGTVEKYVGDAVLAVFGVPDAHEDDAHRACRAALDMKERMGQLNEELEARFGLRLALRIGVNTGEVVAGDVAAREAFVAGDAVNTAARLEQNAPTDGIILGDVTFRLVRDRVEAEPVEPILAKGKAEPLRAYRLVSLRALGPPKRGGGAQLVGRHAELNALERCFGEAVATGRCVLATVVGEPGVGKSRLAGEAGNRFARQALVLTGRCLAYGEGITFWALREIVFEAAEIGDEDSPAAALAKLGTLVEEAVAGRLGALFGLGDAPLEPEEVPWTVRRLLEVLARDRPLICIIEDLHWAEAAFLDLLDQVAVQAQAPVLLLCTARPELAEERQDWPVTVRLQPLPADDCSVLIEAFGLGGDLRRVVLARAGGNPLFCEELAALLAEDPSGHMPASLTALLTARLDRLPGAERAAAELGAVEGEVFHLGAVNALAQRDAYSDLTRLAGRMLVSPAKAEFSDDLAFRFKHALVRDAAYGGLAKRSRAELHERFADWLAGKAGKRAAEFDEILGYHLERAYRYRLELALSDDQAGRLAERAAARLMAAGERVQDSDPAAALNLLERARSLLEPGGSGLGRVLVLLGQLFDAMGYYDRAAEALERAVGLARADSDERLEHSALLDLAVMHAQTDQQANDELRFSAEAAIPALERLGDDRSLAHAYANLWLFHCWAYGFDTAAEAAERELAHATRAGDRKAQAMALSHIAQSAFYGTRPVGQAITSCRSCLDQVEKGHARRAWIMVALAVLLAMDHRFTEARAMVTEARSLCAELGFSAFAATMSLEAGQVERLAGDPLAAEAVLRAGYNTLVVEMGDRSRGISIVVDLVRALCDLDRYEEALELATSWQPLATEFDLAALHAGMGRALAHVGRIGEAEQLILAAIRVWAPAEELFERAEMELDLADTYRLSGRLPEAQKAAERALDLCNRKENRVSAARASAFLSELAIFRP
jgi:class 3 adenylate cyclase/tetratricopeptide (TPR) repeat protein